MSSYSIGRQVDLGFDEAMARVTQELRKEGFGVLTDIDVQATLKNKLGVDVEPYHILGACNPPLAHRAITAEPEIGALLPCNVVVRTAGGRVFVEAMDPLPILGMTDHPEVHAIATEVRGKIERVLAAL